MRVVLLGHGISYSASPVMQNAAFAAAGLTGWTYELLDIPSGHLAEALERLRGAGFAGANVTIPHKQAVMPLLDEVDEEARALGAVNTIVREGERLRGSNTDVEGMRTALGLVGVEPAGARAVVLGAGGSARAAKRALEDAEAVFVARDPQKARDLGEEVVAWENPGWHELVRHADVVVNATPLGRHGEMPFPPALLNPRGAVVDLVYVPGGTPLVHRARTLGIRCVDGWPILLAQGAASFRAWTGLEPPVDPMRTALESVMA